MPADDRLDKGDLRREFALHTHYFPEWEKPSDQERALAGGEIIALLTGLGVAVANLDKSITSVEAILGRLRRLYIWARKGLAQESVEANPLTEREKILVSLFDAYVVERQPASAEQLATRAAMPVQLCEKHLAALQASGFAVRSSDGAWLYRPS
jgi:hypothetical protein